MCTFTMPCRRRLLQAANGGGGAGEGAAETAVGAEPSVALQDQCGDDAAMVRDDIREDLFSPFKTTKERGTGLGLSTVARIASSHGGVARAEDAPGGGSTFRVRWPRKNDPDIPFSDLKYSQSAAAPATEMVPVQTPAQEPNPAGKVPATLEELLV